MEDIFSFLAHFRAKGISISLDDTLENLRITGDLGALLAEEKQHLKENKAELIAFFKNQTTANFEIQLVPKQNNYAISDAQRRIWVLSQFDESGEAHNISGNIYLSQEIEIEDFKKAINATIKRHEILRTIFKEDEIGEIKQWVVEPENLDFEIDFKDYRTETDKQQCIGNYIQEDWNASFDLEKGPLLRAALLRVEEEEYVFFYNMHHIISDGWSMEVLSNDVFAFYESFQNKRPVQIDELRIQYKDYSAWQLHQLDKDSYLNHRTFWIDQLSGELPLLDLPTNQPRPRIKTHNGKGFSTYLNKKLTDRLKQFSDEKGGSLFMSLLAVWNVLMHRYTGATDIITGTPIAGREHAELENQIGFYANTLALRNFINANTDFNTLYEALKVNTLACYTHQAYPFDRLVEELNVQRDTSRSAVFDAILILQNNGEKSPGLNLTQEELNEVVDLGSAVSKFDIELTAQEIGDDLALTLVYNPDVYESDLMQGLLRHYRQLINSLLDEPTQEIAKVVYLSEQEINEVCIGFNDTDAAFPKDKTCIDQFEIQVAKSPNEVALRYAEKELTYRQLDDISNQMAHFLVEDYGVKSNDIVGIKHERTDWFIVSILAVLKAGAAYVPIDPQYPQDRIVFIENDVSLKVCIDEDLADNFIENESNYPKNRLDISIGPDDLAYVIYTSGSTGNPKGVMIEHGGIVNMAIDHIQKLSLSTEDNILQFVSFSFDGSVLDIFMTFLSGGTLVVVDRDMLNDQTNFIDFVNRLQITVMTLPPAYLRALNKPHFDTVRLLITAGESAYVEEAKYYAQSMEVYNAYGPTEATVNSTLYKINSTKEYNKIPIGRTANNKQIYILNNNLQLQPKNIIGEICIGGVGLAKGYLNQIDLTNEKFIKNPFIPGERLYKTGDLGRWLSNGDIEFIGRKDDQVKIRGYRIELGEIEQVILKTNGIEQAVVVVKENDRNERELCAYFIGNKEQNLSDLRNQLSASLPEYMIPAYFVQLTEFPITNSGKINKRALPAPDGIAIDSGIAYSAPQTEIEHQMVRIWEEVLQKEKIGVHDDFFVLGGHSLKAVGLSNEYQKEFAVKLSLKDLFAYRNIKEHIDLLQSSNAEKFSQIPVLETASSDQPSYSISVAQRRLWILSQFEAGSTAYNLPDSIYLNQNVNIDNFKKAIDATIDRHEILRTVFKEEEQNSAFAGEIRQWVLSAQALNFEISYQDFRASQNKEEQVDNYLITDAYKAFDLEKGPLFRAALLQVEDDVYVFSYNMHHIISDGWSLEVLSNDIFSFYEAFESNKIPDLTPLRIQYKDVTAWQIEQMIEPEFQEHQKFWLNRLSGELPQLDLPSHKKRPKVKTYNGIGLGTYLDKDTTTKVKDYAKTHGGSPFMVVLAAWNVLMHHYTANNDIIIGTAVAGRDHVDLKDQIGFYINTLALRNTVDINDSFDNFYDLLKENTVKSYAHQSCPFDTIIEDLNVPRDAARNPVFDLTITYHNIQDSTSFNITENKSTNEIVGIGASKVRFDIELHFQEENDLLSFNLYYNEDVYDGGMTKRLMAHFKQLLKGVLENSEIEISKVNYLSVLESEKLVYEFNNTNSIYPNDQTIVSLFEGQAAKLPNNMAVSFGDVSLSYRQLNEQANQLANCLKQQYLIGPDDLVGIELERSELFIISLLGVLKAGGAYVPINSDHPSSLKEQIIADTTLKLLITEASAVLDIDYYGGEIFAIDVEFSKSDFSSENLPHSTLSNHLAYIMYTSGSTGTPKGIMVENKSVLRLVQNTNYIKVNESDRILGVSNFSFDGSTFDIFMALLNGAGLVISAKDVFLNLDKFNDILKEEQISSFFLTTVLFNSLVDAELDGLKGIKYLLFGGEQVSVKHVHKFKSLYPNVNLHHVYGPTENTTYSTWYPIIDIDSKAPTVPIGSAISNSSAYILNEVLQPVPVGVIGEICVGGDGLARGYLNRKDLTKEKFVENPFIKGERMYKTGDLGRWTELGQIEFVGRKDSQVKIRGHRIELGEIEHALLQFPEIEDAVVIIKENEQNEKDIVAYITSKSEQNANDLRAHLRETLPPYMLPSVYVQLDDLPLNSSGKVDKKKLPNSDGLGMSSGIDYVAPRNNIEEVLAEIWEEILQRNAIGIDEGFFDAGGNSIRLIALKSKIEQALNTACPVASLFEFTTIRQQADNLFSEPAKIHPEETRTARRNSVLRGDETDTDIAVIGMSIKTPKAKNIYEFWNKIQAGKEFVSHFSQDELLAAGIPEVVLEDENYVKTSSRVEQKECFDSGFFGYVPDEAKLMDPQTRVFHEVVWSAIEDSGYDPYNYKGFIGLFSGAGSNPEWEAFSLLTSDGKIDALMADQLSNKDFANTLIAHKLNLKGSANSIKTACSTSLVAIHHAALSILSGENDMAVAGGVTLKNGPIKEGYHYQEGMILSKDGHNRTFDALASGTVGSEGAGAVVLKKLSAAQADGDQIYAVLKGSAINNDGDRKVGYTAPSVNGQAEVIQMAQNAANVSPESISYVEAHGTATKLGDPIEMRALTQAFGKNQNKYCAIGSLKTNVGHLDTAAGVAGFIKTALCLRNKQLVPSLHFNSPNPAINFEESPFYVNTELKTWDKTDFPRRAGISSFGIGGTNAHVILEEAPEIEKTPISKELELIPLSAKTPEALMRQVDNLKAFLIENPALSLADVAWTLQNRSAFSYRSAIVANSVEQAITKLETWANQSQLPTVKGKRIAFMFSGQGTQYENMGRGLYDDPSSIFRKSMDTCFELAAKESTTDFKSILYPREPNQAKPINETINTQPILFMFEYALAKQLAFYGIHPDIMIGHSIGEYVAACLSGVLSLETALQLVIKRGALMQNLPKGDMLAVGASSDSIKTYLTDKVDIAAVNTPDSCTVSGEPTAIAALLTQLEQENIPAKTLHTSHAFHSGMMDPMLDEFTSVVSKVEMSTPSIPYISNVTGKEIKAEELTQEYWSNHIRGAVKFSAGINEIQSEGNTIFIEVGPGHSLSTLARQHIHTKGTSTAHQLIRHVKTNEADDVFFMQKLAQLWQAGIDMDWKNEQNQKQKIWLPNYAFEQIKYPMPTGIFDLLANSFGAERYPKREDIADWFYELSWKRTRLIANGNDINQKVNYLVFSDNDGLAQGLIDTIKENNSGKVIEINQGTGFEQIDEFSYTLNPQVEQGYKELFENLSKKGCLPNRIIHCWNYTDSNSSEETAFLSTARELDLGYHSLLHIAKSLGSICPFQKVDLEVITSFASKVEEEDSLIPSRSAILGPVQTIPKEYDSILCRHIDVLPNADKDSLINQLLAEGDTEFTNSIIAYRRRNRWTQFHEPVKLAENEKLPIKFKNRGIYLITGGMGGMGIVFTKFLVEEFKAKLILTGRNPNLQAIKTQLQEISPDITYLNVDVSNAEQMELRLSEAEKIHGQISGIIHTAGIGDFAGIIQNRSKQQSEEVFESKVFGTIALGEIARKRELDFLVLCSSAATIAAPFGQVAYTAANIFQDSFARADNTGIVQSIGWDTWSEKGMAVDALSQLSEQEKIMHLNHGLSNAEGVAVLKRVLAYNIPSTSVCTRDIEMLLTPAEAELEDLSQEPIMTQNRPALENEYKAPSSETEQQICALFEHYFGIKEIGITDDFFDLGMDSLKAMTLSGVMHKELNVQLKINDILENANISLLAKKIDSIKNLNQMQQGGTDMHFEHEIEI